MGCFNYRCGVSNANILHGDEVAVVFFSLQHSYDDVPVRAPVFFAEYNVSSAKATTCLGENNFDG